LQSFQACLADNDHQIGSLEAELGLLSSFEVKSQVLRRSGSSSDYDETAKRSYYKDDDHWTTLVIETPASSSGRPLVVDLDGTLIASDLLIETAFSELGRRPHSLYDMLTALSRGKAALKHRLAEPADFNPSTLPYDPAVLALIRQAKAEGRPVYLASASHCRLVESIAQHLGEFTGWFASDETTNLAGARKAQQLIEAFGERGFDYVGNDAADLAVWSKAAKSFAIRAPNSVRRRIGRTGLDVEHLPCERPTWRTWAKMLRVHQYAKNALVFVPLLMAHIFTVEAIFQAVLAFVAFSLCASSIYILNDLVDLQDDRGHRSKCNRPLASGAIPLMHGVIAIPVLFLGAVAVAAAVSLPLLGVLLGYFALTTAYSFALKRIMIVDVLTLAGLYSVRVIGGAVATGVWVSEWLLAFCMMIFMALALIKRYVELAARRDALLPDPTSRDYKLSDLDIVAALAAAAGFNAVTVLTLYISSDDVHQLYTRPQLLWLAGPLLMYWIARALMLASRRLMDDDPVVFAIKDKVSLMTFAATALLIFAAI
jgi:4-hydroxybenzoate polyprenyltransferase/phosphoserine phosphatase